MKPVYLVESPRVTSKGTVTAATMRAYEVHATKGTNRWGGVEWKINPTGRLFLLQPDGSLEIKATNAKLSNKYLGYRAKEIISSIDALNNTTWGALLFSSPELAIAYKQKIINKGINKLEKEISTMSSNLTTIKTQCLNSNFLSKYPELML